MIQIGIYITKEQLKFLEENHIQKSSFARDGIKMMIEDFKKRNFESKEKNPEDIL
jgi:hypothetical protein